MKVRLEPDGDGGALIIIPEEVLEQLGWTDTEEVIIDIPMTGPNLIIHRKENNFPLQSWGDKREKL